MESIDYLCGVTNLKNQIKMKNFQLFNKEKAIGRYELEANWVKLYNNDNKLVFEKNDNYFNSYFMGKPNLYLEDYLKEFLKKA